MPRVLILTTSHGASHRRASEALRKALNQIAPHITVEVIDAVEHCTRWFRAYYDSYEIPLRYWPSLWRWIENYQHQQPSTNPGWLYRLGGRPLFRHICESNPDVIVATEIGVCELAVMFKRQSKSHFFLIGLELMDFNRAWIQPEVDLYSVVHPDLGSELIRAGAPPSKVILTGMPIDPAYDHLPERPQVRARLGLRNDLPLLLVLFGGTGHGNASQITSELKQVRGAFQAVFIAGRNTKLQDHLRGLCSSQKEWRVLGWVDNMHDWMRASDLLLSKPGGATVMEAAACGLPLLAFNPLAGNEGRTCAWLEKWQAGLWLKSPGEISATVERLLDDRIELSRLGEKSQSLSRPHAALSLARMIVESGFGIRD